MAAKLQLSPAATITPNPEGVLLQSDLGDFQLHGKDVSEFVSKICPLLNGEHNEQDICSALPNYTDDSIKTLLQLLLKNGLIESVTTEQDFTPPWPSHERFLQAWQHSDKQSTESLKNAKVLVIGLEPWATKMVDELANAGVGHIHILDNETLNTDDVLCHRPLQNKNIGKPRAKILQNILKKQSPWCQISFGNIELNDNQQLELESQQWDLAIVTLSKEAQFWLHKASEFIEQNNILSLYGCIDGLESWLGPVVTPGKSACWNCTRLRRLGTANNPQLAHELDRLTNVSKQTSRARTMLSAMAAICGQQLTMEALKLLLRYTPSNLIGKVQVQNLINYSSEVHTIIPVPWCQVCGFDHNHLPNHLSNQSSTTTPSSNYVAQSAVSTHTQPSNPLNDVTSVEQLTELLSGWIDPTLGVIRQLSGHFAGLPDYPITASAGVSNFTAGQFDPRAGGQMGSGKGLDEVSAHIGAVGEAIERYSAARFNMANLKYASINQLTGDYIDPQDLVLYGKNQYNSPNFPFVPFKRKQKIHWNQGRWIGSDKAVWVPSLVTHFNFNAPPQEQFSQVSSNGLAAGQNHSDAAIRATYELIERDAMMLTWYAQLPCQRLKYDSQYQGKMRIMIDDLTSKGVTIELYLLDVGIHIPTVVCLALGNGMTTPAASVSLSTHSDINVAMRKALLEQGHVFPYLCSLMGPNHKIPRHVSEVQTLEDHAAYYFLPDKLPAFDFMRQPEQYAIDPNQWSYPQVSNERELRQHLINAGVDVAIIDVTSPDVALSPFSVARAVGVHMQPIHFGEQFKRVDNPRLRKLLKGRPVNNNPHPIA